MGFKRRISSLSINHNPSTLSPPMIQPIACPICKKVVPPESLDAPHFPFCSVRCKQIDLSRWLDGKYAVVEDLDPDRLASELMDPDDLPPEG